MDKRTAKRDAEKAGLELYFDRQWNAWGLIDKGLRAEESEWMSPGELADMTRAQFSIRIATMQERIHPDAGGEFPFAEGGRA